MNAKAPHPPAPAIGTADFLDSTVIINILATVTQHSDGGAMVQVPLNRPKWLIPPISWIFPFSDKRKVKLDEIGSDVLNFCNGKNTVETIIENFAAKNKLSFREAQLPVTKFFQLMTERGIIVIVGPQEKATSHEGN